VAKLVVSGIFIVVGVIWIGQGVGAIGGSFMTGQAIWAVFGGLAVLFGLALIRSARRGRGDRAV